MMKIRILAFFAKLMGIQFKIDGFPYGATKSDEREQQKQLIGSSSPIEKKEKWVIEKTGEKFFFTRWLGDQVHESYAPVSQDVAGIYAAAIVQGFQPPRCLNYLDKLAG
ncbi:hypothetical protein ACRWQN_17640 [Shewanella sp. HL-SH8]|uniref:hypothetical protein n=1 Tax=Shewanella sp. HL-SH8 TaxID=3436242 RepID=UPI003EBEE129